MTAPVDSIAGRSWTAGAAYLPLLSGYKFGTGAANFDGSNNNGLSHATHSDFNFGTGDFCIKGWINVNAFTNPTPAILGNGYTSWQDGCRGLFVFGTSGVGSSDQRKLCFSGNVSGSATFFAESTTQLNAGTYYYFEVSRTSGTTRLFINGTQEASNADTRAHDFSATATYIASNGWDGANGRLNAILDDLIIEKGAGHSGHTSNYSVPTGPHSAGSQTISLLHFDDAPSDPGSHRYWRINFTAANSGSAIKLLDVEMRTSAGGADATGSGTASASGSFLNTDPSYVFDSTVTNIWGSNTTCWLKYDFGSGNNKDVIEVALAADLVTAAAPKSFAVQYSDDNSNWTTAMLFAGVTGWSPGQKRTFGLSGEVTTPAASSAARYWRVAVTEVNGSNAAGIATFQLRVSPGGADQTGSGTAFSRFTATGHGASDAFDANASTYWLSSTDPSDYMLGYDFGSGGGKNIVEVAIAAHPSDATTAPKTFYIQRSDDGLGWTDTMTLTNITGWTTGLTRYFESTGEVSGAAPTARPVVFVCT
jgi:hypothetical protein